MTTRIRRVALAGAGLGLVVAAGSASWAWRAISDHLQASPPAGTQVLGTAEIIRTTVVQRQQLNGTLGYEGDVEVINPGAQGVLTWAPAAGTTVGRGDPLFEVDGVTTQLLLGNRPAWRAFAEGMSGGADVLQLEQNLVVLGYSGFTVDVNFTGATAYAVRRWQEANGVPATGTLALGSVYFSPGPLRTGSLTVPVGGQVQPGAAVLEATSTARVVNVGLPTSQQHGVAMGSNVYVTVNGNRLTGKVTSIGQIASAANPAGSGGGTTTTTTIPITISLDPLTSGATDPTAGLEQAPVQVSITAQERADVLAVPVTALVSTASGGYDVVLVSASDGSRQQVAVQPGLLDDITGLIEISGAGLAAGQLVEVPRT